MSSPYSWNTFSMARPWWGGPVVDPSPWTGASGWGGGGGWPGPIVDPSPWPGPSPIPQPWPWPLPSPWPFPRPIPRPRPIPYPVDPWPEDWGYTRSGRGIPIPVPEPGDPSPIDLSFHVRNFQAWVDSILQGAGIPADQIGRATVQDLLEAFRVSITPPVARATQTALSAAQVATLDRAGLERLRHHLHAERDRISTLADTVDNRLEGMPK